MSPIGQAVVDFASSTARNHIADLTGKTSLIDVVDIMGQCACVVSNDSGSDARVSSNWLSHDCTLRFYLT